MAFFINLNDLINCLFSRYLNTYKKYIDLMNNKADQEVTAFLKETHAIPGFRKVNITHHSHQQCLAYYHA